MKRLPFWLLIGMLAVEVLAAPFTIEKFEETESGDPDTYISADFSNQLRKAKVDQIQDGRFYLRQKFEDPFGEEETTYQLFEGRPTAAKARLAKFTFAGVPYTTLIKAKYYLNRNVRGDEDLDKVYFDGTSVYAEGDTPIFAYINGKMQELSPSVEREYPVSLTTQPTGVEVKVGETRKGVTPLNFSINTTRPVLLTLSKSGYYTTFKQIKANPGRTLQEGVVLTPKQSLENPVPALRSQYQDAKRRNNTEALRTLQTSVQEKVGGYSYESSGIIDRILSEYPPLSPKHADENPDEFNARKAAWEQDREQEKLALDKSVQNYSAALESLLKEINDALASQSFSLRYFYVPNSALNIETIGVRDFTVSASQRSNALSFDYDKAKVDFGGLSKTEITNNRDQIHAVVKMWNTADNSGKLTAFHDIAFFYDETPLKTLAKGQFSSPDAIGTSEQTAQELESRLLALSSRADWDSKDRSATLAALEQTAAANTYAQVAQEEPEATYSEEDDRAQMASTSRAIADDDYATDDATYDVTDRFGNTDEYIRWAAWGLAGLAAVSGVVSLMETRNHSEAKDAYDATKKGINDVKETIANACKDNANRDECVKAAIAYASQPSDTDPTNSDRPLYLLNGWLSTNKKTMDSYNTSRIIWYSITATSIAGSVILFTW